MDSRDQRKEIREPPRKEKLLPSFLFHLDGHFPLSIWGQHANPRSTQKTLEIDEIMTFELFSRLMVTFSSLRFHNDTTLLEMTRSTMIASILLSKLMKTLTRTRATHLVHLVFIASITFLAAHARI